MNIVSTTHRWLVRHESRRRAATLVALATTLAVLAVAGASASARTGPTGGPLRMQADGCTALEFITVPGTTEGTANSAIPTGLLAPVATELQHRFGDKLTLWTNPYPAVAFTAGQTYADSKNQGVDLLRQELDRLANQCPETKVGIVGYSQGADVAGDVGCEIGSGAGAIPAANIVGLGLVADPHRGTPGATTVGPNNDKQGIMGPRTQCPGFGALNGRVASICVDGDLYCGVDKTRDPLLAGIANVIGTITGGDVGTDTNRPDNGAGGGDTASQELAKSLISDFSHADLQSLPGDMSQLVDAARSGDAATVARLSAKLADTLKPLADTVTDTTGNPAIASSLKSADAGSPQAITGAVLDTVQHLDLGKAISTASQLANQALAATGGGARAPTTPAPSTTGEGPTPSMADSANALDQQLAPLASTPTDQLATAAKILSTVKPAVWVDQITNIATGTLSMATNIPKILETLGHIGPILLDANPDIWAKIHRLRDVAGDLNNLFQPVVKMAAAVDLHTASRLIGMIPDPNGIAPIISVVVGLLANVDVIGLANEVGRIQNTAWDVLESCKTGCDLGKATGLIGTGLNLVKIALDALGGGTKTPPDQLGTQTPAAGGSLSEAIAKLGGSDSGEALGKLMQQGLDAASFYMGGAHQSYGQAVVDRSGRTTLAWLTDWFTQQFNKGLGA
ncbi:cutinase family protein [Nocardia transvalensis]|uniref:cutinase family protein n=1 Tax=Nocardia transvalensis TaxID=37333 RepID=UPI001893BE3B|nr:cutinase family protein [Nocardia transvalensis]MBF6333538.1 cutinase family protein [Nocardia transvalensis]